MKHEDFMSRVDEIKNASGAEKQNRLIRALYREVTGDDPDECDVDEFRSQFVCAVKTKKEKKYEKRSEE